MRPALKAALTYFSMALGAGFMLGAIRTLWIEPRLGQALAIALEAPVILTVSWFACAWSVRRFSVPAKAGDRVLMGAASFTLLFAAETMLGFAFGRSLSQQLASYLAPDRAIGLAAQAGFAVLPLIQMRSR